MGIEVDRVFEPVCRWGCSRNPYVDGMIEEPVYRGGNPYSHIAICKSLCQSVIRGFLARFQLGFKTFISRWSGNRQAIIQVMQKNYWFFPVMEAIIQSELGLLW